MSVFSRFSNAELPLSAVAEAAVAEAAVAAAV